MIDAVLSASDSEPPPGTIVDVLGERWQRDEPLSERDRFTWVLLDRIAEPETWPRLAGGTGPAIVLRWGYGDESDQLPVGGHE